MEAPFPAEHVITSPVPVAVPENATQDKLFDPYIKMESALPRIEANSAGVYEVPIPSRPSSPTGEAALLLPPQGESSNNQNTPEASAVNKTDTFIEDDYVNPALFRKDAESQLAAAAQPDASIYESMVVSDHGYAKVKNPTTPSGDTSEDKAEGLYDRPRDALQSFGNKVNNDDPPADKAEGLYDRPRDALQNKVNNSDLRRTYTADNQYVQVRPQTGRRNASQPILDVEDPYATLSDLYVTKRVTITAESSSPGNDTHVTPSPQLTGSNGALELR